MLTFVWIDVFAPNFKISSSLIVFPKAFAHDSTTADEIALELFNPYPVGMFDLKSSSSLVLSKIFFGIIFSINLFIKRELIVLFSDVM